MARGSEQRRLNGDQVQIRLPAAATAALATAAAARGETKASFVRRVLLAALGLETADVASSRPARPVRPQPSDAMLHSVAFRREVAALTLALREASAATGQGRRGVSRHFGELETEAGRVVRALDQHKSAVLAEGGTS